jgi:hypothetical protein
LYLLIYQIPDKAPCNQPNDHRQWHRACGGGERHARNKHHGLEALAQHGDERQDEHGVLLSPALEGLALPLDGHGPVLETLGQLDTPLLLHLGDTEQRGTEDGDDDRGDDSERALPVVLGLGPLVLAEVVEDADQSTADGQADEEAQGRTVPDLWKSLARVFVEGIRE